MAVRMLSPGKARVGWIGLGVMGTSMCGHLVAAGYDTVVHTRTRRTADPLLARGASWADRPSAVAAISDVVFTMLGFPRDVRDVVLGPEGTLAAARPGTLLVDMTTSEPSLAIEIAQAARARSVHAVDAPVSGGDIGAREARLSIMVGGDPEVIKALQPCFSAMGTTIVRQGGPGAGQHAKLANQILVASGMVGVCEALLYGYRAGLDLHDPLRSVSSGAAASWALDNLAPRIIAGDFAPGFFVEHLVKDLGIALAESERMQLALPGLALARRLYAELQALGHGRDGTQALQLVLAKLSGVRWPSP